MSMKNAVFAQTTWATDDMSKFGYTSVILLDLGAEIDKTYHCDFLLSQ